MKQTSSRAGRRRIAALSVSPPVERTKVSRPCAPITSTACTTLAAHAAVEKGRTMPVVPRMEMPPMMPSRAFVVFSAIFSPPGTLITTRTPRSPACSTSSSE
jgi:hypothetical protein